jgi:hypothetical protein
MSHTIPFDTLNYANRMIKVGFTREQAEEQATAIAEIVNDKIVTKEYFKEYLDSKITSLYLKIILAIGGMFVAAIAILDFLLKR